MAEARKSRSRQDNLPIIHYYEEFVNKGSSVKRGSHGSQPRLGTLQKHIQSKSSRGDPSRFNSEIGKSLNTDTTESLTTVHDQGPKSPLTSRRKPNAMQRVKNGPSNDAKQNGTPMPPKKLTLYERSQIRLKEREKKLKRIRDEMMRECTFRPNANKSPKPKCKKGIGTFRNIKASKREDDSEVDPIISTPAGKTAATTPPTTASSTRQYWQDLQRKQLERQRQPLSTTSTVSRDGSKTVSTTKSLRFEELYQDGVRKARQRPATEKAERELRMRRQEEKEMEECTFKPKLYWGRKLGRKRGTSAARPNETKAANRSNADSRGRHRSLSPRRRLLEPLIPIKRAMLSPTKPKPIPLLPPPPNDSIPNISMSPILGIQDDSSCGSVSLLRRHHDMMRERNRRPASPNPPLPLEIFATRRTGPWKTRLYAIRDGSISPLCDRMLGFEVDDEGRNTSAAPRIIFDGTTVGGESEAAETQATEYGSI